MVQLRSNLGNSPNGTIAVSVCVAHPDSDRIVIVHDYMGKIPIVAACRFKNGRCYGALSGEDLTEGLTRDAIWSETLLAERFD